MRRVMLGLLGCGTVGRGVVELLARERGSIRARHGFDLVIERILVRDGARARPEVDPRLVTTSARDVLDSGSADVVLELIGGVDAAAQYVRGAIEAGRDVVTANKALLAGQGGELFAAARRRNVAIGFEASVCGAIPIVRVLQRGLAGDQVLEIAGILNGTSNFVLSRMEEDALAFDAALELARQRGFAEADPRLDVSGEDAAAKLRILAGLAFGECAGTWTRPVEGIEAVTQRELEQARRHDRVLKHISRARRRDDGVVEFSVGLDEIPLSHPLASVRNERNAVLVRARAAGELLFAGAGAGSLPTASAVLSDVIEIAHARAARGRDGGVMPGEGQPRGS